MSFLECKALTKRYGGKSALEGVELSIEPGRIVGLLGPNGSGKTTLIKLANGLLTPTSGEILIDGKAPSPETKAIVSYLPDRNALPDWMTVAQTVGYYADFYADFRRDAAQEMLARLGLDASAQIQAIGRQNVRAFGRLTYNFSGGAYKSLSFDRKAKWVRRQRLPQSHRIKARTVVGLRGTFGRVNARNRAAITEKDKRTVANIYNGCHF